MSRLSRRQFLNRSVAAAGIGAGFAIGGTKSSGRVLGANDTIRIGVAGLHGRGGSHVGEFAGMKGVEITYLIDPDTRTYDSRIKQIEATGGSTPRTVQDIRKALDDKELDAVSVATPNHWHSLIAIWACEAGKDVYVEKPCSHNVHEGRVAVEAARKYGRIVQHGTQSRSMMSWAQAAEIVKSGKYGKLLVSRALCYKPRGSIGFKENTTPPPQVDFNLWLGPAAERPFNGNLVHYNWHWFWDFGNGDIGNQGVHQMDIARWMIPGATLPRSVVSVGGRFGYKDQGQTPNTQIAVLDYGDTQLIFEVRGLKTGEYEHEKGRSPARSSTPRGKKTARVSPWRRSATPSADRAAVITSPTSSPRSTAARSTTSTPTSSTATTRARSATSPTSPIASARRSPSTRRPKPSATTRPPPRRSSAWKSTSRTTPSPSTVSTTSSAAS